MIVALEENETTPVSFYKYTFSTRLVPKEYNKRLCVVKVFTTSLALEILFFVIVVLNCSWYVLMNNSGRIIEILNIS